MSKLHWLRAGGSGEADMLYSLLELGVPCAQTTITHGGSPVKLAWSPSSKGPAVIAVGTKVALAALVTPFTAATCEARSMHGLPVDTRGPLNPPDDLSEWWPPPVAVLPFVDAYNALVLAVSDITGRWP